MIRVILREMSHENVCIQEWERHYRRPIRWYPYWQLLFAIRRISHRSWGDVDAGPAAKAPAVRPTMLTLHAACMPSSSSAKIICSPGTMPNRSRICYGILICSLLVTVEDDSPMDFSLKTPSVETIFHYSYHVFHEMSIAISWCMYP